MNRVSEAEIAAVVVGHLTSLGADVYQEVEVIGGVADIVARIGAELWIIEVKQSLSLALLIQAMDRRRLAHRVVIAAPWTRNMPDVTRLCVELGVGLWRVRVVDQGYGPDDAPVKEEATSRRWNTRPAELAAQLEPEHKTHAQAGAPCAAGRWTPFRSTCEQLRAVADRDPGIALKAAIEEIKHHYGSVASARSSIVHWIRHGKVDGVELRDGRLYPWEAR